MMELAVKFGGSLAGILALWWLSRMMGLGGDVRIRDDDHAQQLADEAVSGFRAVAVARDKAGIGALLRDARAPIAAAAQRRTFCRTFAGF